MLIIIIIIVILIIKQLHYWWLIYTVNDDDVCNNNEKKEFSDNQQTTEDAMLTFDSIEKFNRNKKKQILFILIHHLYLYIKNYEFSFKSLPFIKHKSMWKRIFVFIRMNEWKQMMMMIKSLYDHLLVHFTTTAHCYWISFFEFIEYVYIEFTTTTKTASNTSSLSSFLRLIRTLFLFMTNNLLWNKTIR